ncbi:MAG: hypothetical protein PF689_10735, partial [Deltaproteobacteria bacterium]|nr:hypothetical protein [Deltaproteobacteria bacterium]
FILGVKEIKTAIKMNPENEEWRIFSSGMQKLLNGKENLDIEPDQLSGELRDILEYIYEIKDKIILNSSSRKTKLDSHKKIKLVREDGIDDIDQEKLQADFQKISDKQKQVQGKTKEKSPQAESFPKSIRTTPEKRLPSSSIFVQNQNPPVAASKEDPEELKKIFIQKNDVETQISLSNFEEIFYSRNYILLPHNQKYYFRENLFLCSLMEFKYFQAFQRFRGHRTDTPIIDSKTGKLLRCTNGGNIALKPLDDHIFFAIKVDHQPLYIVENHIASFHGDLKWENGWLRSENKKIAMMSFRGEGTVFIQIKKSIFNIKLPPEDFVLIPVAKLLGWQGNIVAQCQSSSFVHAAGDGCIFIS